MKKSISQTTLQTTKNSFNFNLWLTKLFLDNTRLALVSVGVLVILGVASTFLIKSIGFPNPEIKVALIQTVYPGASSDVVNREISIPLEGAVKGVTGVDSITVNSNNSVSIMTVQIKSDADADSVKNKISTAIAGVSLPEDSQKPELVELSVGGPDFILSVVDKDLERVYEVSENLIADVEEYSEVASIKSPNSLEKKLIIKLDNDKLAQNGILASDIIASLQKVGETLPVVSGVQIDDRPQSIVTSLKGNTVEDVKNLEFLANIPPQILAQNSLLTANRPTFKLSDLATVEMQYRFANDKPSVIALASDEEDKVFGTQILEIKTSQGNDLGKFATKLEEQLKNYDSVKFVSKSDSDLSAEGTRIIENYSAAYENGKQLDEVISGLIGGKLDVANPNVANLGWLLGGIQLVFLVMLAFVSWRAAIISALAIPLSLVFSIIYLYFIGESLNTLVLFSLVLVIGLVVDPALVILEAIQRKIDIGFRGKDASLEAVKDVGMGIFLATITNIIVFVPFAVISGLLGEIFAYIPLTIVPATIGSYIVPLVILSWLGGLILKPTKDSTENEEQNMWGVSKALKKLNLFILNSNVFVRLGIVILGIVIPLAIAGFYFSTGKVVSVSFSSNDNSDLISLNGKYRYDLSNEDTLTTTQNVLNTLAENEAVRQVYPFETGGEGFYYYIELYPKAEREGVSSKDVERDLKDKMSKYDDKFFEYNVALLSQGPPSPLYQVALSIQGQEVQNRKKAGLEMGEVLVKTCLVDGKIGFEENCEGEKIVKKVDDGFSGKENLVLDVSLDPKTLRDKSLTLGNTSNGSIPATFLVNSTIRDQFEQNRGQKVTVIKDDQKNVEVLVENQTKAPTTLADVENIGISSLTGQNFRLKDISAIRQEEQNTSILRVNGQTLNVIQAQLVDKYANNQAVAAQVSQALIDFYGQNDGEKLKNLGFEEGDLKVYSEGGSADFANSLIELLRALVLAIIFSYVVLVLFFNSFSQPLVILYTIPLTFIGIFPAIAHLSNGQFGFLEIIGLIILIGVVENVAIFLLDYANQRVAEGLDEKEAISLGSAIRLRPVLMTTFTAIASLAPLAFLSDIYRPISLVIIFGLLTSGFLSLITTPILYIFFRQIHLKIFGRKYN